MSFPEFKTDKLKDCQCGGKIDHYTMGYGRTPYIIRCPLCGKQNNTTGYAVTESVENLYDYWNNHVADMTIEELDKERTKLKKKEEEFRIEESCRWAKHYWWAKTGGEMSWRH